MKATTAAVEPIKLECKTLTRNAQRAYLQGDTDVAGDYFSQAFEAARQLVGLSITAETLNYLANACFNAVQYGHRHLTLPCLQTTSDSLARLIDNEACCQCVRAQAMDNYILVSLTLTDELYERNRVHEARAAADRFGSLWRAYAAQLFCFH